MTERSYLWDGEVTGDATLAPYTSTAMRHIMDTILMSNRSAMGPVANSSFGFRPRVTNPSVGVVVVGPLAAMIEGAAYYSDADQQFSVQSPASGVHYYRFVIRFNATAQDASLTLLGPSVGDYPAITQSLPIWDQNVAKFTINTSGNIQDIEYNMIRQIRNHSQALAYIKRQGGHANNWEVQGTTDYDIATPVDMQFGAIEWTGSAASGNIAITFPHTFKYNPIVLTAVKSSYGSHRWKTSVSGISTTGCTLYWASSNTQTSVTIYWIAIGGR